MKPEEFLIRNAAAEGKNTRKKKWSVKPPSTFTGMIGGIPSIKIADLGSIFQVEENNYMLVEEMK